MTKKTFQEFIDQFEWWPAFSHPPEQLLEIYPARQVKNGQDCVVLNIDQRFSINEQMPGIIQALSECGAVQIIDQYNDTQSQQHFIVLKGDIAAENQVVQTQENPNQREIILGLILRMAAGGAPWKEMSALPMKINRITVEEVEEKLKIE